MEVFAGYSENADWNVGRLLDAIEEMGDLDNTLIFYIWGDNGASMEGTITGSFNEMMFPNGIVLDPEHQLALASRNSVVILRLRGRTDLGTTFMEALRRYAETLRASGSRLVIVSAGDRIQEQLRVTGVTALISPENIYTGDERIGATLTRAYADAAAWIEQNRAAETDTQ